MKLRVLSLLILLLAVSASLFATGKNKMWIVRIDFSNPGYPSYSDSFGVGVGGYTDCIDSLPGTVPIREFELPPPPPSGNTDARFYNDVNPNPDCLGQGVKLDFRAGSYSAGHVDTTEYQIQVADNTPANYWLVKWDTIDVGKKLNSLFFQDAATGGGVINIDMMAKDSIKFASNLPGKALRQFIIVADWKEIDSNYVSPETTGVIERKHGAPLPNKFSLNQNYPNPFNPATTVEFSVFKSAFTEVVVYNILGQKIATIASQQFTPGTYTAKWNGTDDHGLAVSSGVYFVRMTANYDNAAGNFTAMRKILLMK
ncbi:MAG: T9SS type A sorting domain-containing protein [Bacteroidota bacterium]